MSDKSYIGHGPGEGIIRIIEKFEENKKVDPSCGFLRYTSNYITRGAGLRIRVVKLLKEGE